MRITPWIIRNGMKFLGKEKQKVRYARLTFYKRTETLGDYLETIRRQNEIQKEGEIKKEISVAKLGR
jgi:hypothetical protein